MRTDLFLRTTVIASLLALPSVSLPSLSLAADDDWATRSPLAFGEPMEDCAPYPDSAAIAIEPVIIPPKDLAPDIVPAVLPAATKAAPPSTTQAPRSLSPAALLTFALIASPGTALPQTGSVK